ncbi:uncharacterized protein LOC131072299 [Cryptomeria japonica]|uniref:uncharacterized protein LOC131072299 n=1 Tax=Cryptomeria japonica TaxID=3369 RepID=UPI0025AD4467|nr:uncharacterized protein LOC131072299 [Cryptomeria japonica]XP_057864427.1 uncharacterized protein LOC131072299 [Cryptomeria japonica]XP_057864428.1 uncharacterized protein LOC131072299 [Cryptomeria japonica]
MRRQQNMFAGKSKAKLAGGKPKYTKHEGEKWNPYGISTLQKPYHKPPFSPEQSCFRSEGKREHCFPRKTLSMEASPVCAPQAPRNTTSYIIRAKNCGGIPGVINTPSPSTPASACFNTPPCALEGVNQEWGVDSYGSMKGLLRVRHRSPHDVNEFEPTLDRCIEILYEKLEERVDQDLSRFEMTYPQTLETRINGQDYQIAYLKEESTVLKERLHCMEHELCSLKRRMRVLEGATCNALTSGEICSGDASFA